MRVIETFVKYVPREKIPADAKWFMQDGDDGLLKCSNDKRPKISHTFSPFWWDRGIVAVQGSDYSFDRYPLASDAAETVVTREELMRAYDAEEISGSDDEVNHPAHYTSGNIECIDIIREMVRGKSEMEATCIANIVKYLYHYQDKGGIKSVEKAQWYLNLMIEGMKK